MAKKKIPESRYRASRICRALGNPTAFEVVYLLSKDKKRPEQLARLLGVSGYWPNEFEHLKVFRFYG